MKLAFVTQRYMPELTWETTLWAEHAPGAVLDRFVLRSKNFSLVYELGADVYVVEDGPHRTGVHEMLARRHPEGIAALYATRKATPWQEVPWGTYDAVICIDPCLTPALMAGYPRVLWCYYAGEHMAPGYKQSCRSPLGGYDVFLDHVLRVRMPARLSLPCSVPFPALVSQQAFDAVLEPAGQDNGAFLDSRALRGATDQAAVREQLAERFGVPVRAPHPWDYADSYAAAAGRQIMPPRAYLDELRRSRYFVLMRGTIGGERSGLIGQAAIEAAACGCIVLSGHGAYPDLLCHELCYIDPDNWDSVMATIRVLERSADARAEVLAHQGRKLRECFWEQPMALLDELVRLKKEQP